jgi:N-acetylglucosaminyldiphosphoundecaprenol N-acetyl-beta-D-mannosaminyltransferase
VIDPSPLPEAPLRGITVHAITREGCVSHILRELDAGRGGCVVTPNLDHLRRLDGDENFRAIYSRAELRVADGMPVLWAARLAGHRLPERVAGSDLIWSLSEAAARAGRSVFLLGGDPGAAEAAAAELCRRYPGLAIAGWHCPPMGFDREARAIEAIERLLAAAAPDIVFVALGSPKQEILIDRIRHILPRAWWLGVGISFSFVCGRVKRAPRWIQQSGLEWLYRLTQEPKRLARRYLLDGIPFASRLLLSSCLRRIGILSKAVGH